MRSFVAVSLLAAFGCASAPEAPRAGAVRVECVPADAEVYLDDRFVGSCATVAGRALAARAGLRRIEIRREGYFTRYIEVDIAAGRAATVSADLRGSPDA